MEDDELIWAGSCLLWPPAYEILPFLWLVGWLVRFPDASCCLNRLKHRGPDWSGLYQHGDCYLAHQRLAVIDPASGDQPLLNEDGTVVVTVNGEIYNHEQLRKLLHNHKFRTGSDCDVIAHLVSPLALLPLTFVFFHRRLSCYLIFCHISPYHSIV